MILALVFLAAGLLLVAVTAVMERPRRDSKRRNRRWQAHR